MCAAKGRRFLRVRSWTWAHRLTALGFFGLLVVGRTVWFPWFQGSPTAARWFHVIPLVDPLSGMEVILASRSFTATLVIGVAATAAVAVVLGRVFCAWLCPLGLILEVNQLARPWLDRRLQRRGIRLPQFQPSRRIKYWLLAVLLGMSFISAVPVFTTISPINLVLLSTFVTPVAGWLVIGSIAVAEYFAPRAFCRAVCPLGAFYGLAGRWSRLRVWIQPEGEGVQCQQCSFHCPMGIRVMEDHVLVGKSSVDDPECTRCGACIDVCTGDILRLDVRRSWSSTQSTDGAADDQCVGQPY